MQRNNNSTAITAQQCYNMIMAGSYILNVAAISFVEIRSDGAVIHMMNGDRVALMAEESDALVAALGVAGGSDGI